MEYLELDSDEGALYSAFHRNRNHDFERKYIKINKKTTYTVVRLIFLFIFYYLDNFQMTEFIRSLVNFLLIHEAFVISNYIVLNGYIFYQRITIFNSVDPNISNLQFPVICSYLNSLNNM